MVNMNRVIVAGNLTKDPELRYLPSGAAICSFSIAVNRKYKAGDQMKEEVSFFDVEAWGRTAETSAEHLHKGRAVLVEGRLKQERWEAQGGGTRSKVLIVAESVQFLGSPKDGQAPEGAGPQAAPSPDPAAIDFDS